MSDSQQTPGAEAGAAGAAAAGATDAKARTRLTPEEKIAALEKERQDAIRQINEKIDMKIAKIRRNAVPASVRKTIALDAMDKMREAYRTATGKEGAEDAAIDSIIKDLLTVHLTQHAVSPEALSAATAILNAQSAPATDGSDDKAEGAASVEGSATTAEQPAADSTAGAAAADQNAAGDAATANDASGTETQTPTGAQAEAAQ